MIKRTPKIKLDSSTAALICLILREVDRRETFKNDPPGAIFHLGNLTKLHIEVLEHAIGGLR